MIKRERMFGVVVLGETIIFHIDVNSAYLSWSAVKMIQYGSTLDIRKMPSVIAGKEKDRHGIVLAASIPAKKYGIKTGETIYSAKKKCKNLKVVLPDFNWYIKSSNSLFEFLNSYTPKIEIYSIDECFLEFIKPDIDYMKLAEEIKERITEELGFNCNIGISTNKLLAKMASDLKPKNSINTLFKNEIEKKMWKLSIGNLFMVGKKTEIKLKNLNINTIGDLAKYDLDILISKFKSQGILLKNYANGIDVSKVKEVKEEAKGMGNSTTISYDVEIEEEALDILLSLTESLSSRLRKSEMVGNVISIYIKNNKFINYSHQKKINTKINSTKLIFKEVKKLFLETWNGEPIRHIGIRVSNLSKEEFIQGNLFDYKEIEKESKIDQTIDLIRNKYGNESVMRSNFINTGIKAFSGGTDSNSEYPMMKSGL